MSRRTALIVTGVAALGLWLYLASVDQDIRDTGGPGIVGYEFVWTEDRADEIHADWGKEGRDEARRSLWVDYAFMLAYGAFFILASAATRDLARERGWSRLARLGAFAVPMAVAAPVFDALENAGLLLTLDGNGGAAAPLLGSTFACLKFAALTLAAVYVIAGLVQRLRDRRRTRRP